jgi:hypothetical protein
MKKNIVIIILVLFITLITVVIVNQIYNYRLSVITEMKTPLVSQTNEISEIIPREQTSNLDCSVESLSSYERLLCIEKNTFDENDNEIQRSYNTLSLTERNNFDCTQFLDPLLRSNCTNSQKYSEMMMALRAGKIEYCETAFLEYGDKSSEYADDCKVAYVVDFSEDKNCEQLKSFELIKICQTLLERKQAQIVINPDLANQAYNKKDISLCAKDSSCIDTYYLLAAKETKDILRCDIIEGKGLKAQCQYSIAVEIGVTSNNVSICDSIIQESLVGVCMEKVKQANL